MGSIMKLPPEIIYMIMDEMLEDNHLAALIGLYGISLANRWFYYYASPYLYYYSAKRLGREFLESSLPNPPVQVRASALNWAIKHNVLSTVRRVISLTPTTAGLTHEHVSTAIMADHFEVASLLLDTEPVQRDLRFWSNAIHKHQVESPSQKAVIPAGHPVRIAAIKGHLDLFRRIFQSMPQDFYIRDDYSKRYSEFFRPWSPLHYACLHGQVSIVRFLLESGANPATVYSEDGYYCMRPSPIALAMERRHVDIAQMLIQAEPAILNSQDSFFAAITSGSAEIVRRFLEVGTVDVQYHASRPERSPLWGAIRSGNVAIVRMLLDSGANTGPILINDVYTLDRRRDFPCALDTVVDCAKSPNSAAIAELLLDHGAVWPEEAFDEALLLENIIFANNVALMKLLIGPAKVTKSDLLGISKSPEMMNFLLDHGLDVHEKTSLGEEPIILHAQSLSFAISPHPYESFKVLVSHRKNPTKARGNDGETVLAACCQPVVSTADNATLRAIKLMLSLGADHSATDNLGVTPLHKAVQTGFVQGIRELVAAGADIECKDQNGLTPLHHAAACKTDDSLREMILLGADLHAKTNAGLTALHMAFRESKRTETDIRYPRPFTDRIPIIKLLLSHGMDPNERSTGGVPALHIPHVAHGDNLKALLDLGADPSERDLKGLLILNALLSDAFKQYDAEVVLKAAGAKVVNLEDCNGRTPLWVASEYCRTQRVELLLRYGADINAVNGAGQTVLDRVGNWREGDWQLNYFTEVEVANFMTFMRSKGALRADEISLNTGE